MGKVYQNIHLVHRWDCWVTKCISTIAYQIPSHIREEKMYLKCVHQTHPFPARTENVFQMYQHVLIKQLITVDVSQHIWTKPI